VPDVQVAGTFFSENTYALHQSVATHSLACFPSRQREIVEGGKEEKVVVNTRMSMRCSLKRSRRVDKTMNKYADYSESYARAGDDYECKDYSMRLLIRLNGSRSRDECNDCAIDIENIENGRIGNSVDYGIDKIETHCDTSTNSNSSTTSSFSSSDSFSDGDSVKSCLSASPIDDAIQKIIEKFSTAI